MHKYISNLTGKLWRRTYNEGYEWNPKVCMPTCKKSQNTWCIGDNDLYIAEPRTETKNMALYVRVIFSMKLANSLTKHTLLVIE